MSASAQAQLHAVWVESALTDDELRDLHYLLSYSIDVKTRAEIREARIGLLLELVRTGTGEVPSRTDYVRLQRERAADGDVWPSDSAIVCAYGGHWLTAVREAMRLQFRGGHGRAKGAVGRTEPYVRDEVLLAIRRCHRALGEPDGRPTQWEFCEWAMLQRDRARSLGLEDPRAPGLPVIRKLFGTYDRAVTLAFRS